MKSCQTFDISMTLLHIPRKFLSSFFFFFFFLFERRTMARNPTVTIESPIRNCESLKRKCCTERGSFRDRWKIVLSSRIAPISPERFSIRFPVFFFSLSPGAGRGSSSKGSSGKISRPRSIKSRTAAIYIYRRQQGRASCNIIQRDRKRGANNAAR